ncbi:isoprenylcysteine carboxylmethyltransferase family protein [Aneurinibacillus sp. Ricciae_BoGa-3]|uniref:isoprenylcysteine carboxyl methyltransferase family protein n=1 Tax=Aneurinibacillus sp. Ricciae_BoGa-3 TaxID=3022697 RepID=UPI0023416F50|nr:isoprenylcysteine carboxylmethyltransferase family protein [Aneurinibacillus sp. Ricciae_BoGa-3]WCK52440.1 isoprenylcysteine carboxylmethyltransferase family protein [Aneurinibacillus sp. Ricciae_BoGa-3]
MIFFYGVFLLLVIQRLTELWIAKRNRKWVLARGGIEIAAHHYPLIVSMHTAFLISLLAEVMLHGYPVSPWWAALLILMLAVQVLRYWAIASLGPYWNTRIFIIPGAKIVQKGPYLYMRHPNYLAVILEIALVPLLFEAYVTFFIFSVLNALMLRHRIKVEEEGLARFSSYQSDMGNRARFMPGRFKY